MGIRIHKKLGYGLSLSEVKEKVCTPNLGWDDFEDFLDNSKKWEAMLDEILKRKAEGGTEFTLEGMYIRMIRDGDRIDKNDTSLLRLKQGYFGNYITYNNEFGCEDTVLFQPLTCSGDWSRYDDSIDYIESSLGDPQMVTKVVRHNRALYPYINLMKKNSESYLGIEEYWVSCYLDHPEFKDSVPTCTRSVMLMLKYMGIVPEDKLADTIMLLRPTIYTYWS